MNERMLNDLKEFCKPECNRYEFIINWLTREEITHSVIPTGEARHIMIRLDKIRPYLKRFYVKTLVAHYDRVPGTPGANDNSAAVLQLLYSIEKLKALKFAHNIQIILTDREEIPPGSSISQQGAFQLGRLFRENKVGNCLFFVLDMCGIGDTLISGQAGIRLLKSRMSHEPRYGKILNRMKYLNASMANLFLAFRNGEFLNINTLFSDDLGFLLNGYPSIQLSVLPYGEAMRTKIKSLEISSEEWSSMEDKGMLSQEYRDFLKPLLPLSWAVNHSAEDKVETLDETAFNIIDDFIMDLADFQLTIGDSEL